MKLTDNTKKLLKIGGIVLVVLVVLVVVAIFIGKSVSKSSPSSTTVHFEMIGPGMDRTVSVVLPHSTVSTTDVGDFITTILQESHLSPWKNIYIYWTQIQIDGKNVALDDGKISEDDFGKVLPDFLNKTIGENMTVKAVFKHTCTEEDLKQVQSTCDPCKGEKAVCSDTGAVCKPNQYCPDVSELTDCCKDPNKPYIVCDPKTFQITCETCPEKDKPDCGKPDCKGTGPKCTETGWVCAQGVLCPDKDVLKTCCSDGEYATCKNGTVYCSICADEPPDCNPSCEGHGLVCQDDGKWACDTHVKCPPPNILQTCCTDKDPYAICTDKDKDGLPAWSLTCGTCDNLPKPPSDDCPERCNGQGWVCTSKGWVCKPGVKCPTGEVLEQLNCCPSDYTPYCTESNCIGCKCPSGKDACGTAESCLTSSSPVPPRCCDNGVPCSKNPLGEYMCCAEEQACDSTCCPTETICKNGQCMAKCGVDSDGKPYVCSPDDTCVIISNVTASQLNSIKAKYPDARYDEHTMSVYVCAQPNNKCTFSVDEMTASPPAITNYYPCYAFPSPDPNSDGPAYCVGKQDEDTLNCFNTYKTKADCEAAEKKDGKCEWRDAMAYMAEGTTKTGTCGGSQISDIVCRARQITKDMGYIQDNWQGDWCSPEDEAYQRMVTFGGGSNCTWEDCFSQISQPGIIDVEFNETTKTCVGLQACNSTAGKGMINQYIDDSGNYYLNPQIVAPISQQSKSVADFPQCDVKPDCPLDTTTQSICDDVTGRIEFVPVYVAENAKTPKAMCHEVKNPSPSIKDYPKDRLSCMNQICTADTCCLPGWSYNAHDGKCYQDQPVDHHVDCGGGDFECHADSGSCGPSWYSHCHCGNSTCGTCHGVNCQGGNNYGTDGDNSNPCNEDISTQIPYCICQGTEWKDFKTTNIEVDSGSQYKCTVGENADGCILTYQQDCKK